MKRLSWIDNLRVTVIILVVMVHAGVTYSGLGSWYYTENEEVDTISTIFFAFFQTFTQAYFMSLLFMVSGYFSVISLEKKGTGTFFYGRLKRLGIPLLIFIFLLQPVSVKLAYPDLDIIQWYFNGIRDFRFISWTGPLWFVEALLIFTIIYLLIRKLKINTLIRVSFSPDLKGVITLILLITLAAFLVRLVYPIGTDFYNLQFSFFSGYVFMFAIGIIAGSTGLFERISFKDGKRWLYISLGLGIPAWLLIIFFGGPMEGSMLIEGGMNWPAFSYALWESFFCVTFIFALVGLYKHRLDISGPFQQFLSDHAFGVFVFHAPVLIAISMLLKDVQMYPVLKFFMVSAIAVPLSFVVAWLVRMVRPLRKIFT